MRGALALRPCRILRCITAAGSRGHGLRAASPWASRCTWGAICERSAASRICRTLSFSFYNVTPVGYPRRRVMSDTNRIAGMLAWNLCRHALGAVLRRWASSSPCCCSTGSWPCVRHPGRAGRCALLTGYFQNRILHWNRRVRKLSSRITGAFNEGITGAKTSKTLVIEDSERLGVPLG